MCGFRKEYALNNLIKFKMTDVSDAFNLNMRDIGQTMPDCQTITILVIQNVRLDMR